MNRFRTGPGKPGKSWNLGISVSRPGKSLNLVVGHENCTVCGTKIIADVEARTK